MQLSITADRTMGEIQQDFQAEFPFLKLVFFQKGHKAYKSSHSKFMLTDHSATMRDLCDRHHDGLLFIESEMPTWQVERLFEEEFGLHVQIFRKSGNVWLETSVTDDLSLDQQNAKGKASEWHQMPMPEPMDYREQD